MTPPHEIPNNLENEITGCLAEIQGDRPTGIHKWTGRQVVALLLFIGGIVAGLTFIPNRLFDPDVIQITYVMGAIATWRYLWWFNHARRAEVFAAVRWPRVEKRRDEVWADGWRPRHLHIQMTTYREEPAITRHVVRALLDQIRAESIPTTIWIGTGAYADEAEIEAIVAQYGRDLDTEIVFVRQNQPGKRMAIGLVMRAIIRSGPDPDDLIIFMDGDTVFGDHALARCCGMFGADRDLQALTTDEDVITFGPDWMRRWLDMRFTQRRLAMQSHAMSDRVLTLTGRMSMFRARMIINQEFVRTIEADHLVHWLRGRFRFLSGDDKSTWFYLLSHGAKMGYVPDACVYTVEIIEGRGFDRMVQNLRRWSGNMLRNGARALALGPRQCKPFIWMCILDQRIAIWTTLIGPALMLLAAFIEPWYIISAVLWVLSSRLVLSLYLFRHARMADMSWPFILYANQIVNAGVKVYAQFFLNKQTWANRGKQRAGHGNSRLERFKDLVATYQFVTALGVFLYFVGVLGGRFPMPSWF
jgi:glycosyltransferase Alg8